MPVPTHISAGEGVDFVNGGDGTDIIFAGAGDDQVFGGAADDIIYGDAGADRIFGDDGNDTHHGRFWRRYGLRRRRQRPARWPSSATVTTSTSARRGNDTLTCRRRPRRSRSTSAPAPLGNGTATGSQIGSDTLWGIENVNTGSGDDTITASNAVNVMNGGAGNDIFRFNTTTAANGDTILGFEPGDRLDLSGIDANVGAAGNQTPSRIVSDGPFTQPGSWP